MDGYLSNKPDNFVDDPEKLYRLRRREAQQAKKLDFVDSKSEDEGSLESSKNSPPQSLGESTSTDGRSTARTQDWGAMHPGHRRPANLEPHRDRKAARDQDLNNPHGATFTLHQ
jgi:hypothetical protein